MRLDSQSSAKRVSDILRDLESGFLVSHQRRSWLECERARWLLHVRQLGNVDDLEIGRDACLSVFVSLLGELAASLIPQAFRAEFLLRSPSPSPSPTAVGRRRTATSERRGISLYQAWMLRLRALSGIDETAVFTNMERRFSNVVTYGTETDALPATAFRRRNSRSALDDEACDSDDPYSTTTIDGDVEQSVVEELSEEVKRLRCRVENAERALNCGICLTAKRDAVIFPCMHAMYCHECVSKHYESETQAARKCPCCRAQMTGVMRIFP